MEKREKEEEKTIKDKINSLTVEQREILIREYIHKKIVKVLREQPESELPAEEDPTATLPEDPAAITEPTTDPTAPPAPAPAPATDASAPLTPEAPAAEPAAEPAPELDPAAEEALAIQKFVNHLREKEVGNISRIKAISKVINAVMKEAEPEDRINFYTMLRQLAISKLQKQEK
jgi:hypothetical protein